LRMESEDNPTPVDGLHNFNYSNQLQINYALNLSSRLVMNVPSRLPLFMI